MSAPLKRWSMLMLAAGGVWIVGCDDQSAGDKAVQQKLELARNSLTKLGAIDLSDNPDNIKPVHDALLSAVGEKSAGPVWRATAAGALGDIDTQTASLQQLQVNAADQAVRDTLGDLRVLAQQVALTNYLAMGYQQFDPKSELAQLGTTIAEIQGGGAKATWAVGNKINLPTLSAGKAEITRLEAQIADRKQQLAALNQEHEASIKLAEQKFEESRKLKGDAQVSVFTESAQARRKSEEVAMNIEIAQDQLNRLQADLAIVRGQEAALNAGVTSLQEHQKAITAGWTGTQQRIAGQRAIASSILSGGQGVNVTINEKVGRLVELLKTAKAQRDTLRERLDDAAKYYNDAVVASQAFSKETPQLTTPGAAQATWKSLREGVHAARYKLQLGNVLRQQGVLSADEAALLGEVEATRALLQTALRGAELAAPSDWSAIEKSELTNLLQSADEKLRESNDKLLDVPSGDAPKRIAGAGLIARLVTLHRLISVQELRQSLGATEGANAGDAQSFLADARQVRSDIVAAGLPLPALPGELGVAPAPETPTPAPAPVPAPAR